MYDARAAELRMLRARATLHPVATATFRPHGGRYDGRRVRTRPVRALRGGANGLAASYRLVEGSVENTILAREAHFRHSMR